MKPEWIGPPSPAYCFVPLRRRTGCRKRPSRRPSIADWTAPPASWTRRKSPVHFPPRSRTPSQFVVRNMRVAARKTPEREDVPQYSKAAVFEAVVNAVAHRDYSMSSRRIRLSMFKDRLEIDSPGQLPNGMTIEGMEASQATRNEVIASVFGRIPVGNVAGSDHRRYLMERRGDGVSKRRREASAPSAGAPANAARKAPTSASTVGPESRDWPARADARPPSPPTAPPPGAPSRRSRPSR